MPQYYNETTRCLDTQKRILLLDELLTLLTITTLFPRIIAWQKKKKLSEQFRDGMITAKIHGRRGVCEEDKGPI